MVARPDDPRLTEQLTLLIDSVTDYAIFLLDVEGHIRTWNPGAERLKGYSREEIVGRHFSTFYTDEDRARDHPADELRIAIREGRYEEEGWRLRKDGSRFWAHVVITTLRNADGEHLGFGKVTRDLTARREAEEALRAANEELDRFASVAAHDLQDPLRTVAGFAQLLEREELGEEAREFLGHLTATTARMQSLLDSLLEFARAGGAPRPPVPVALEPASRRVLAGLTATIEERAAAVDVALPDEAAVLAAEHDVELILQNLLANALKFADPDAPRVRLAARRAEQGWEVSVTDNGPGIDPADQRRIFAAFERAHAGERHHGTGLGLAIAERLARRHGGRIGVESTPGQGARFWVSLPSVATA